MNRRHHKFFKYLIMALLMSLSGISSQADKPLSVPSLIGSDLAIFVAQSYKEMISFDSMKPPFDLYERGLIGYLNILYHGTTINNEKLTLIDFRLSSAIKRMWIIDMNANKVLYHRLVAHGKNTGEDYATAFSNIKNSNQSSLGFYLTGENYIGKHGLSLRLDGIEQGFNDMARDRAIVMHSAHYVDKEFVKNNGRLGRSFGCPAIALPNHTEIITALAEQSVLFIYYPKVKYEEGTQLNNRHKAEHYLNEGTICLFMASQQFP
jgi:hypothetical protein